MDVVDELLRFKVLGEFLAPQLQASPNFQTAKVYNKPPSASAVKVIISHHLQTAIC